MSTQSTQSTRRDILLSGLAVAGLGVLGIPDWAIPALAQDEVLVAFADLPENSNFTPSADRRLLDLRKIDGPFTPIDQFYTVQHYGHPNVDPAMYRLTVSGLVNKSLSLSLDDLRRMRSVEIIVGFECSGNRRPLQGLASNGRWTGVALRSVLADAGLKSTVREVVFFGADHGMEDVEFRAQKFNIDQHFGRSLSREKALSSEPLLAYALNGEPLTRHQGSPLRLLVPGWYGVSNVKWLTDIHAQEDPYLGKYQARWYRSLRSRTIGDEVKWTEAPISHLQLKSFIARVTKVGGEHKVLGVALTDGTPLKAVEVSVDGGPWQPATLDPSTKAKYSWKLFTFAWKGATPGEHTIVSRATDVTGAVQPTEKELETKKTFLEDNSQHPRRVVIS
jgi:DMSO/TMAO reductase YedYZ molybdopterin-dependent catalytic subunit